MHCNLSTCALGAEEFLLEAPEHIVTTFLATFSTREYNEQDRQGDDALRDDEEDAGDDDHENDTGDQEAYRLRVSKWLKGSLEVLDDPLFWFMTYVSFHIKGPVRHLFNILSTYSKWHASSAFTQPTFASSIPVVNLVVNRIWEIDAEFKTLCDSVDIWTSDILLKVSGMRIWCNRDEGLTPHVLKSIALSMALRNYAAFHRRIVQLLDRRAGP